MSDSYNKYTNITQEPDAKRYRAPALYAGHLVEVEGLEVVVVVHGIEAGALFEPFGGGDAPVAVAVGREVAVAEDDGAGIVLAQPAEEPQECGALCVGAGVGGTAVDVESAFVADADAVLRLC